MVGCHHNSPSCETSEPAYSEIRHEHAMQLAVFEDVWAILGRWMQRRSATADVAAAPAASIGWKATPKALRHMIELLPDHRTIGVLDDRRELVGLIDIERARALLIELDGVPAIIVADLI
jgi:hypothetical protein